MKSAVLCVTAVLFLVVPNPVFALCGDGVTDSDEQCDDQNTANGDGCSATCTVECESASSGLINGDFEFPATPANSRAYVDELGVPGWFTDGQRDELEFRGDGYDGVVSDAGVAHIELNARNKGNVYQEISTVPGMVISWQFSHRAERRNRTEEVEVLFGETEAMQSQGIYGVSQQVWVQHTGIYTVPPGQFVTRFEISSEENGSKGNLIDNVFFSFQNFDAFSDCPVVAPGPVHRSVRNGRVQLVSNGIVTCNPADLECAAGQSFTDGAKVQNSQFDMVWIDADSDGTTFNSSAATLNLNAGESVVWAGLYWTGGYTDFGRTFITPPPDVAARNTVKFKVPGGNYVNVTGTIEENSGKFYRGFADVTSLLAGGGEYWVADIQASYGKWLFGGWTLVVVTDLASAPKRTISVYDPYLLFGERQRFVFSNFADLYAPDAPIKFGTVLYDGDVGAGDMIVVNSNQVVPDAPLDPAFPGEMRDIGNSTIRDFSVNVTDRTPAYENNFGYDSGTFDLLKVPGGSTELQLEMITRGDVILTSVFVFQTDVL